MAYDAFMYFDDGGVEGETADKTYKDKKAFEIYSFSWGMSNPVTIGSQSTGTGGGKVSISSFSVMKKMDSSSHTLMDMCATGTHAQKAHVVLRKAGGTALEYLTIDFDEIFVESVQMSGSSGGDDTPTESVSFAFKKYNLSYQPQDEKGAKAGGAKTTSWNVSTNDKV